MEKPQVWLDGNFWQSTVSAFEYAVYVAHSFCSKEQTFFNFMAAVTICSYFGVQEKRSVTVSIVSSSIWHEVMGLDAMILVFWMLSFKSAFSFSSFTFIKRLSSSCLLSSIRMVSSAYMRLLTFLPAILIPACASSSPTFLMMYSAYELNKQRHSIQPWCTPFPLRQQSIVPCPVLIVFSSPAYRYLRTQVRWCGIPNSKNFLVCCDPHSQRL